LRTIKHPITGKEMPEFLTGVITPMLTALNEDLTLDEEGNRSLIRWYKKTRAVTTVFARSGVGQMAHFSFEQVKQLIDVALDEARDEIFVVAGTSGTFGGRDPAKRPPEQKYVEETLELSKYADRQGATGVVIVSLGLEPSPNMADKVFDLFKRVDASIDIPIAVYEPPGINPAYNISPPLLHRLADLPKVKGMKLSSPDMLRFGLLCDATKDQDFTMVSGHEGAFLASLVLGAGGVIGGGCNTHPELIREIFDAFMAGDWERARMAQFDAARLLGMRTFVRDPYSEAALSGVKVYLARKGVKIKPYQWAERRSERGRTEPTEKDLDLAEKAIDEARQSIRRH